MAAASIMSSQAATEAGGSFGGSLKHSARSFFCSSSSSPCNLSSQHRSNDFAAPEPWTDSASNIQALQQVQRRLSNHPQGCPDEATLIWFLRDSDFSVDAAESRLKAMLTWRTTNRLFNVCHGDVAPQLQTGKAYLHGCLDLAGRPTVVIRARKHISGQFPIAESKRLSAYMIDSALSLLQQPQRRHEHPQKQQQQQQQQQQEQILWIVDLQGISMSNIDLAFVMFVLQAVPECYPKRVGQVLFVDAPWIFKAPWEAFKPLLRKYAALVRFVSRRQLAKEYFTADTLPADFKN
ncbi:CRAL-TRIO domain-containing protein [Scenedesmus sp. NREL 46B-D3]|nr:CRAL-TRIO domain-containing protein [Scenedesmus sp. NREL 46B-D3]